MNTLCASSWRPYSTELWGSRANQFHAPTKPLLVNQSFITLIILLVYCLERYYNIYIHSWFTWRSFVHTSIFMEMFCCCGWKFCRLGQTIMLTTITILEWVFLGLFFLGGGGWSATKTNLPVHIWINQRDLGNVCKTRAASMVKWPDKINVNFNWIF